MYYILDSEQRITGMLSPTEGGTPILDDLITTKIADSNASDNGELSKLWMDSLTMTLPTGYDDVDMLDIGQELLVETLDSWRVYTIDSLEDIIIESGHNKQLEALNSCIWKMNHTKIEAKKFTNATAKSIFQYIFQRSGWTLDEFDEFYAGGTKSYEVTAGTAQSALDSALKEFEVEVDAYVIVRQGNIIDRRIRLVEKLGEESGVRFEYAHNLKGATRKKVGTEFYTKLYVYGGQNSKGETSTITSVNKVKNPDTGVYEYLPFILSDEENDLYNHGNDYLEGEITNDKIISEAGLLTWGRQQAKYYNHPRYEYTVDVALLDNSVNLGDTVQVIDNDMTPAMTITARVVEVNYSQTDPNKYSVVLGEFTTIQATTPDLIWSLMAQANQALLLAQEATSQYRLEYFTPEGTDFNDTEESKRIIVRVFKGNQNVTSQFPASSFRWERLDAEGNHDELWEEAHATAGNTLVTSYLDADYTIRCTVSDGNESAEIMLKEEDFLFSVRLQYFPEAVNDVNRRVAQYVNYEPIAKNYYWSQVYNGAELTASEKVTAGGTNQESITITRTNQAGTILDRMVLVFAGHGSQFGIKVIAGVTYIYTAYYNKAEDKWYSVRIPYQARTIRWGDSAIKVFAKTENERFARINIDAKNGYALTTRGLANTATFRIYNLDDFEKGNYKVKHKLSAGDFGFTASQIHQSSCLSYPYLYITYGGSRGNSVNNDQPRMKCVDVRTNSVVYDIVYAFDKGSIVSTDEFYEAEAISVYWAEDRRVILQGFAFNSEDAFEVPKYNMVYAGIETVREVE